MPLFRDRCGGYLATGLIAFTSGITLYLLVSDTVRRLEISRRKKLFLTALDDEASLTISPLERARRRYGVLRVGGRFVNPFDEFYLGVSGLTSRWREQGAWEWVMWKVLTLFKFNPAGLPRNSKVSALIT